MFSVLILNKSTTESFNEYYPLFLDAIKSKDVAVCRWYENGGDIDSVLPDIHDLTDDKKEWRAVIVKTEDDFLVRETRSNNPYDYTNHEYNNDTFKESDIPIIRLTHYLGGFPTPSVQFSPELQREEGKETRVIYKPYQDEEKVAIYSEMSKKYSFDGHKPTEIVLITLRKTPQSDSVKGIKDIWTEHNEINSSEFWKRNCYPSNCRFIVYDLNNEGPIQREADMFSFWTTVLLLSTNEVNPNYLQAYRLYKINVDFNKDTMQNVLQTTVTHLIGTRHYVEKTIQRDIAAKLAEEKKLPNFEVNIPVTIDLPSRIDFGIKSKRFPITPSSEFEDNVLWNNMKHDAFNTVDDCVERSERALDESAETMRYACEYDENSVRPLDKYQKKDMEKSLSSIYSKIILLQGLLPKASVHYQEKLVKKEKYIRELFKQRINNSKISMLSGIIAGVLLLAIVPALICYTNENIGDMKTIITTYFVSLIVILLITLFVLIYQKIKLNSGINDYNNSLKSIVGELNNNAKTYSNFISAIATYSKGENYLKKLATKKFEDDNAYVKQRRHINAINSFLSKINRWTVSFNLNVSFDINDEINFVLDYEEKPQFSRNYTFKGSRNKKVAINKSGDYIDSPFEFVEKINLEREELYDESGN